MTETTAQLIQAVEALVAYDIAQGGGHTLTWRFCNLVCPHQNDCMDAQCGGDEDCIRYIETHPVAVAEVEALPEPEVQS